MHTVAEVKHRNPYKPIGSRRLVNAQKQMILDKMCRSHHGIYGRLAEM